MQRPASRSVFDAATGDNVDGDPVFLDAALRDFRLAAGSPGIDAADYTAYETAGGLLVDLSGSDRTANDQGTADTGSGLFVFLDAGAYEFQGVSNAARNPDYNMDTLLDIFDITDLQ